MVGAQGWWHGCGGVLVMIKVMRDKIGRPTHLYIPLFLWEKWKEGFVLRFDLPSLILVSFCISDPTYYWVCQLACYVNPLTYEWAHGSDLFIDLARLVHFIVLAGFNKNDYLNGRYVAKNKIITQRMDIPIFVRYL